MKNYRLDKTLKCCANCKFVTHCEDHPDIGCNCVDVCNHPTMHHVFTVCRVVSDAGVCSYFEFELGVQTEVVS